MAFEPEEKPNMINRFNDERDHQRRTGRSMLIMAAAMITLIKSGETIVMEHPIEGKYPDGYYSRMRDKFAYMISATYELQHKDIAHRFEFLRRGNGEMRVRDTKFSTRGL